MNTGAITCIVFTAAGAAMLHIFQHGKCIRNMLVRFIAFDIGYETNATGIMFKSGRV